MNTKVRKSGDPIWTRKDIDKMVKGWTDKVIEQWKKNSEEQTLSLARLAAMGEDMETPESDFVTYEEGEKFRAAQKEKGKKYKRKNTPNRYIRFMNEHECSFRLAHPQEANHKKYMIMFACICQHVQGNCVEECLDQGIAADKKAVAHYNNSRISEMTK